MPELHLANSVPRTTLQESYLTKRDVNSGNSCARNLLHFRSLETLRACKGYVSSNGPNRNLLSPLHLGASPILSPSGADHSIVEAMLSTLTTRPAHPRLRGEGHSICTLKGTSIMARTAGSKNRTRDERKRAAYAEFLRLEALDQAEDHPWIGAYKSVVEALDSAVGADAPKDLPDSLASVANTLRGALSTIRTVARASEIDAVRTLLGGEIALPAALATDTDTDTE